MKENVKSNSNTFAIHFLKTESYYFYSVQSGAKTFEVRKNDRNFQVGDFLALQRLKDGYLYDDAFLLCKVTFILDDERFLQKGYVCLGIEYLACIES